MLDIYFLHFLLLFPLLYDMKLAFGKIKIEDNFK